MENRSRQERIVVRCSPEEKNLIIERCKRFGFRDISSYIRKVAIDVTVVSINTGGVDELAAQIGRIGNNVNQIARLYNSEHNLNEADVDKLLEYMKELVAIGNKYYDDIFALKSKSEIGI